ncbi:MAG: DUF2252 domain-containing protein [Candidatus Accumulibacter sp.]|uniref:DUF2252 domain-containing protein n=1 Tax=Accumulibacter sp. TaxID=2053492 RepID=UPI0025EBFDEC|nr:DUF2252 domain-containing protein [Accumulibacter sp.]MCM8598523.1 DUF2252 domain-containing protein [Accumulibacter sp.]MCM8662427.1 DUF2252 domain-containing protein [Accumulibacter sp.]
MSKSKVDDKPVSGTVTGQTAVLSPQERRAQGSALREVVPRETQGGWKAPKKRRDPIEVLTASNEGRMPELVPIRFGRMLQSPFTFYRGSAAIMAADLASTPSSGLRVQACGDAHLLNFGGFATPERQVVFDVNDLDETLPAPWEWDLKRLAASIVIAAQYMRLHDNEAARAATATVRAYRERMVDYSSMRALDVWYDTISVDRVIAEMTGGSDKLRKLAARRVEKARQQSAGENVFLKLAEHHGALPKIKDNPPLVFHLSEEQAPGMRTQYREALATYRESLPEHVRVLFDRFRFCDLAVKVVGVGSVGTQCLVALFMAADNDPLFLQIKEARASVLEPYAGQSLHANHGQRVVAGQRLMQAASDMFLGWTAGANGRHFYFRQLRDVKISAIVEGWDVERLATYGRLCARALARAHARSGDAALIAGYMGSSAVFDEAICEFAVEYSDQNQRDYRAFVKAIREGRLEAQVENNP